MPTLTETLRTLHRIHRQHSDLKDRLSRGPRQIQAAELAVKKCETDLGQAKEAFKQAKMASDEKQLQLKHRESKVVDLQAKLNMAQSNKEYQLLKDQMAADKQANSVLADEILETLETIDQLQAAVKTAESNLNKTKDELAKVRKRISDQQQGLETELAKVRNELHAAEGVLEGDFKDNYLRLSRSMGEDSLAPVEGECCGGCSQTLTVQMLDLLSLDKPVFCMS
ncbi:MAG: phospholipase, partial [Planctomycetia bacterium]|nr:phospholipase [Planctomycetia bacterium]